MANPMIRNFMRAALGDKQIASTMTYNSLETSATSTARSWGGDQTILGSWSETDGDTPYEDRHGKYVSVRQASFNCNDEQPILKLGDRITNDAGIVFTVAMEPRVSAYGKARYSLTNKESIAGMGDRGEL